MKKRLIVALLVLALLSSACSAGAGGGGTDTDADTDTIKIVSSFTIISDMAETIGGNLVSVYNLVPTGTDPHEYEPLPSDIKAATDADMLFYNGLNLEGGDHGWFNKMIESVSQKEENIFNVNKDTKARYLTGESGKAEAVNPHAFLSPLVGILMAENIKSALVEKDPGNKDYYEKNARDYIGALEKIDQKYRDTINSLAEENRLLVTSERAFQYMAEDYGLKEAYVWEIDTEELGTKGQIKSLIDLLEKEQPPVIFLESNVDPKPLETVSAETGIPIYEELIYSDEIGEKGDRVDSYIKLLEHNIRIIQAGLS